MDSTNVNWAEMAGKIESAIVSISETVKNTAPKAWRIAIRQVYSENITSSVIVIIILLLMGIGASLTWDICDIAGKWVVGIILFIWVIITLYDLRDLVMVVVNPDYYGVMKLLKMSGISKETS